MDRDDNDDGDDEDEDDNDVVSGNFLRSILS